MAFYNSIFGAAMKLRTSLDYTLKTLTLDQLNEIPQGYNNNIMWNIGHILSVNQLLVYKLSSTRYIIDSAIVKDFQPGTQPRLYTSEDVAGVKQVLISSMETMQEQYDQKIFGDVVPYMTRTKFEILTIEDAISFDYFHTGYHMGLINTMAMKINR